MVTAFLNLNVVVVVHLTNIALMGTVSLVKPSGVHVKAVPSAAVRCLVFRL
jgi:hypothetical protein